MVQPVPKSPNKILSSAKAARQVMPTNWEVATCLQPLVLETLQKSNLFQQRRKAAGLAYVERPCNRGVTTLHSLLDLSYRGDLKHGDMYTVFIFHAALKTRLH